LTASEPQ